MRALTAFRVLVPLLLVPVLIHAVLYTRHCTWGPNEDRALAKIVLIADPHFEGDDRVSQSGLAGVAYIALSDLYESLVAASIARQLRPTHTVMLGDFVSSDRIAPSEFLARAQRVQTAFEPLFRTTQTINVSGNCDIGYGSAVIQSVLSRFEETFGPSNAQHVVGEHLIVKVNGMLLQGTDSRLMRKAWNFVEASTKEAAVSRRPVVLVTHIPLFKRAASHGCQPFVIRQHDDGSIVEQSHLSEEVSSKLLTMLRPKFVLSGHDHNGCVFTHEHEGRSVVEYTVRSVMGDYGGNAMLFTIAKDPASGEFQYTVSNCAMGLRMNHVLAIAGVVAIWVLSFIVGPIVRLLSRLVRAFWRFLLLLARAFWRCFQFCFGCCFCCCRRRRRVPKKTDAAAAAQQAKPQQPKQKQKQKQPKVQQKQKPKQTPKVQQPKPKQQGKQNKRKQA